MKNPLTLVFRTALFSLLVLAAFQFQSCSSHKGMVSCPDLHSMSHHSPAMMAHKHYHHAQPITTVSTKTETKTEAANKTTAQAQPEAQALPTVASASITKDVPSLKNPKEIFKELSAGQRLQVKEGIANVFSKNKMLKNVVLKKYDRLDKKYPAPAVSAYEDGGGTLSTGEVLSIVAIVCSLTWVLGLVGLILGIISLVMINRTGGRLWARILAIVAIVLGAIALLSFFGYVFFVII